MNWQSYMCLFLLCQYSHEALKRSLAASKFSLKRAYPKSAIWHTSVPLFSSVHILYLKYATFNPGSWQVNENRRNQTVTDLHVKLKKKHTVCDISQNHTTYTVYCIFFWYSILYCIAASNLLARIIMPRSNFICLHLFIFIESVWAIWSWFKISNVFSGRHTTIKYFHPSMNKYLHFRGTKYS